jgi:hypothetical protein
VEIAATGARSRRSEQVSVRNYDDYDETKSVRSNARPLNISLANKNRVRRLNDVDKPISKPREDIRKRNGSISSKKIAHAIQVKPDGLDALSKAASLASNEDLHSLGPLSQVPKP